MRIVIAGTTYYPAINGQAIFMVNLAEGLAARGHEVMVLFPEARSTSRMMNGARLEAVGSLSLGFLHNESYAPIAMKKVGRALADFKPDIVHIHDHYPLSVVAVREARRRGIPVIGTNHFTPSNLEPYIPGSAFMKPLLDRLLWGWMLRTYRHLDFVTAPSEYSTDLLKEQGLRVPMQAIACGADLAKFHPGLPADRGTVRDRFGLKRDLTLLLYVGRLDREKGVDVLLDALHKTGRTDLQLAAAGEGAELGRLQSQAQSLGLADRVHFLGTVSNQELPGLMNAADIYTMASRAELLSIASLEAMASGLPLVVSEAFQAPKLYTHGENCLVFPIGDSGAAARCIVELVADPSRWIPMGEASVRKVRPYSLEMSLDEYSALYVRVIENPQYAANSMPHPVRGSAVNNRGAEIAHRSGPT